MRPKDRRRERGSVTVLTAGLLFLAGTLCLVTVDFMRTLESRAGAQTAADAAALAAARELALPSGVDPSQLAAEYAERNGATLISCQCPAGAADAIVEVRVPVDLIFVGPDRFVTAWARAIVEGRAAPDARGDLRDAPAPGRSRESHA